MKCPKCGYNSFEYYDSCKKCSADLTGFKQTYSITSMVLPLEAKEKLSAGVLPLEDDAEQMVDTAETHGDIFAFDLPADEPSAPPLQNTDPFNFDEPLPEEDPFASAQPAEDVFSSLLETSSPEESPFGDFTLDSIPEVAPDVATVAPASAPASAPAAAADDASGPVEFDLESFSWDDSPVAESAAPEGTEANTADAFDSLFGDPAEDSKK